VLWGSFWELWGSLLVPGELLGESLGPKWSQKSKSQGWAALFCNFCRKREAQGALRGAQGDPREGLGGPLGALGVPWDAFGEPRGSPGGDFEVCEKRCISLVKPCILRLGGGLGAAWRTRGGQGVLKGGPRGTKGDPRGDPGEPKGSP